MRISASVDDEDDWVLEDDWGVEADDKIVDGDWIPEGEPSSPPRALSNGFFLINYDRRLLYSPSHYSGDTFFTNCINSIPIYASICSSVSGIVLARDPCSRYFTFTPNPPKWNPIVDTIHPHPHFSLSIIASAPGIGPEIGFFIICAVPRSQDLSKGIYRIEVYESSTGKWKIGHDFFPFGEIVPSSGVSCGSIGYFRTTTPSIVMYDADTGITMVFPPPPKISEEGLRWELGEAGGQIQCVVVRSRKLQVYRLGEINRWEIVKTVKVVLSTIIWDGGEPIYCQRTPRPLRFQGESYGIALWVDGRVGRWNVERRRAVGRWTTKILPPPGMLLDYVPFCFAG